MDVARLLPNGPELPDAIRERVLALGDAAVAPLLAFVASYRDEPSDGEDHARGHAAELLAALGAQSAIPTLLSACVDPETPMETWLHVRDALPRFGEAMVEPTLAALAIATHPITRAELCAMLVESKARSERILRALLQVFAETRDAARFLADYGDASVLPVLRQVIATFSPDVTDPAETRVIRPVVDAYLRLGGSATDELGRAAMRWRRQSYATDVAWFRAAIAHAGETTKDDVRDEMPRLELVQLAEPLLERVVAEADKVDAIVVAEKIERIALLAAPERERAIEAMVSGMPARAEPFVRALLDRYRRLFLLA